jgi:hypothetical protein
VDANNGVSINRYVKCQPASKGLLSIGWLNVLSLTSKTTAICELIEDEKFNVFALIETWLWATDNVCLWLASPPGYTVVDAACTTSYGRSIAVVF